jgi:hydroxyacyl-ACP dehydratase HTD2-like protein with hotdog domain
VRPGPEPLSVEVTATTVVLGAIASRDWRPMHHDHRFATERNGVQDIFLNTPNQAAWFERYVTDWTGPRGRIGQMTFRMRSSVFPGDTMTFTGKVTDDSVDEVGCRWITLEVTLAVGDRVATTAEVRVAVPVDFEADEPCDNPWARRGDQWRPEKANHDA